MERFKFLSDDDGHNYLVPIDIAGFFTRWCHYMEGDVDLASYPGPNFDKYRINGIEVYSFEKPIEDQ